MQAAAGPSGRCCHPPCWAPAGGAAGAAGRRAARTAARAARPGAAPALAAPSPPHAPPQPHVPPAPHPCAPAVRAARRPARRGGTAAASGGGGGGGASGGGAAAPALERRPGGPPGGGGGGGGGPPVRRIILLRHADSEATSSTRDHERPISGTGRAEARSIARRLRDMGWAPDLIIGARRDAPLCAKLQQRARHGPHGCRLLATSAPTPPPPLPRPLPLVPLTRRPPRDPPPSSLPSASEQLPAHQDDA
jgi:hypothetical protein